MNNLNINDRDKAEIASFWAYQNVNSIYPINLNGKNPDKFTKKAR